MRFLYTLFLYLVSPLFVFRLFWKSRQNPGYREAWQQRFGFIEGDIKTKGIWIHAVSVGEVQATQQLVRQLQQAYPQWPIIMTTTTPTGADRVQALFGNAVQHFYFPYDLPMVLRRWLKKVQPRILLMMETEIWPNLLAECRHENIPALLANARLSGRSAKGYARLGKFTTETFRSISHIAAQSDEDAKRFCDLGVAPSKVTLTGSIKFDVKQPAIVQEQAEVMRRFWGGDRPVWVAASTRDGEEDQVLDAHAWVRESIPDALLVLVPRHPERFDKVATLCEQRGFEVVRRSSQKPCQPSTGVFLGDSMGELPVIYKAVDLAFVGGSLVKKGGQNILEPAALGVPVLFGPHMYNFSSISRLMLEENAAVQVQNCEELAAQVQNWLSDASERSRVGENGYRMVESNKGALEKLIKVIESFLST